MKQMCPHLFGQNGLDGRRVRVRLSINIGDDGDPRGLDLCLFKGLTELGNCRLHVRGMECTRYRQTDCHPAV